jgi:RimJ/RimL family protein N-acetyltransferase
LLCLGVAMEKMPYQERLPRTQEQAFGAFDWRLGLPTIQGDKVTLREIRESDAASLMAMLTSEEVAEFISPLPQTLDGFRDFIAEGHRERLAGESFCFAIVPEGYHDAMGLFQVRQLEAGFASAEWGFALGSAFWGSGIFQEGGREVVDFAFGVVGVHRLEARSLADNERGNAALRKMGALQEGTLRRSFLRNGTYSDQILWSILKDDWRQAKVVWGPKFH